MITDRRTRRLSPAETAEPTPPPPTTEQPIRREIVVEKQLKEVCLRCGHLVIFAKASVKDERRYVTCPDCGASHCLYPERDTYRALGR